MVNNLTYTMAGLFLSLFLLMACGQGETAPLIEGTWAVSGHTGAQVSAMGPEEASSWIGKVAQYTGEKADFDGKTCESPVYKRRMLEPRDFQTGFRILPSALGHERGSIEVIEVYCGEREWEAPGGTLIRLGEDKLFVFWEGIFFRLQTRKTN